MPGAGEHSTSSTAHTVHLRAVQYRKHGPHTQRAGRQCWRRQRGRRHAFSGRARLGRGQHHGQGRGRGWGDHVRLGRGQRHGHGRGRGRGWGDHCVRVAGQQRPACGWQLELERWERVGRVVVRARTFAACMLAAKSAVYRSLLLAGLFPCHGNHAGVTHACCLRWLCHALPKHVHWHTCAPAPHDCLDAR